MKDWAAGASTAEEEHAFAEGGDNGDDDNVIAVRFSPKVRTESAGVGVVNAATAGRAKR